MFRYLFININWGINLVVLSIYFKYINQLIGYGVKNPIYDFYRPRIVPYSIKRNPLISFKERQVSKKCTTRYSFHLFI